MTHLIEIRSKREQKRFFNLEKKIYHNIPQHRSTEADICHMLVSENSVFLDKATMKNFLIVKNGMDLGRFSLIDDPRQSEFLQAGYVEFLPELKNISHWIYQAAEKFFYHRKKIVIGLNAHLNYGAGFLASHFDQPPVFGLPYTPDYYLKAFSDFNSKDMVSYRFSSDGFIQQDFERYRNSLHPSISIRSLRKSDLQKDGQIYTSLNNRCFQDHPYWADRDGMEDFELFKPFRYFLDGDNLIFAFHGDRPVGFLLWYPDFNQLVGRGKSLGLSSLFRFRMTNTIDTIRFTEVAIDPDYSNKPVVLAMIMKAVAAVKKAGYSWVEGGFIFEENKSSMNMAMRFIKRACHGKIEQVRRYRVFEGSINE